MVIKKHVVKKLFPNKAKNEVELLLMEINRLRKGAINKNQITMKTIGNYSENMTYYNVVIGLFKYLIN